MKRTKKQSAKNDPELSNYFKKLSSSTEMSLLKEVLVYLHTNTYDVKEEEIIQLFRRHGFTKEK